MSKIMRTKIKGMSVAAKATLISLFTLLLTVGLYQGWQMTSHAAITAPNTWTSAYAGTTFPNSATLATLTIPAGANRLLVVAVASTRSAVGAVVITDGAGTASSTPTVGGKSLTLAAGDATTTTNWTHTALYYLKEADIAAMTGSSLSLRITGGTSRYNAVHYRVFTGVDQTAPITDAKNYTSVTSSTTFGPFASALNVGANDQAIEIASITPSTASTTSRTITFNSTWSTAGLTSTNTTTLANNVYTRQRTIPTTATTDTSQHTASNTATYKSMTALSMKAAPTTTTLTVSVNTPVASGTRLDTDPGVVMQRVTLTGSGAMELNSLTLDDLGTANALASAEIYISPTLSTTLPVDAVLVGSATNWAGTSTALSLTGGTAANRSLGGTEALTKYLYVVYDMSSGQAGKTVQSSITAVGVVSPNVGATGLALNSNIVSLSYAGNLLQTSAPLTGASAAKDSDSAVVMQHFKVDCNTAFDNVLELNSLTLQELGTTAQVSTVKIYVSTTEDADATKLPSNAILVGQITDWNKASISIPLINDYGATAADRTVLAGTSKYMYVVYSMFYPDDADYVAGKTVQSNVTAVGAASPDTGLTGLNYLSNSIILTRGTWSRITSCGGCHDTANIFDATTRSVDSVNNTGRFPGSHRAHSVTAGYDCSECHIKPAVYNHASGEINFAGKLEGDKYTRSSGNKVAVSNATYTFGTCSATNCHGQGSPTWAYNMGSTPQCQKCHADQNSATFYSTASPYPSVTSPSDAHVGAHDAHLKGSSNYTSAYGCAVCHTTPATVNAAGHMDGTTQVDYPTGSPARINGVSASYSAVNGTCATYCHGSGFIAASKGSSTAPAWSNTGYLAGTPGLLECATCHAFPPSTGDHGGLGTITLATCNTCHPNENINGTFADKTKHINGSIESNVTCITCHSTVKSVYRRQVVGAGGDIDNAKTSHHIKYGSNSISVNSCAACHDQTNHKSYTNGVSVYLKNLNTGTSVLYDGTTATAANLAAACSSCHDATHSTTTPFSDSGDTTNPPNINWTAGSAAHQTVNGCYNCHGNAAAANTTTDPTINGHSGSTAKMLRTLTNPYNAATKVNVATNYCYNCHGTTVANGATDAIQAQIAKTYGHKNVTCGDCHNMHAANGGNGAGNQTAVSGIMAGALAGALGNTPVYSGGGPVTPGLPGVTGTTLYFKNTLPGTPTARQNTSTPINVTAFQARDMSTGTGATAQTQAISIPTATVASTYFMGTAFVSPVMTAGTLPAQTYTVNVAVNASASASPNRVRLVAYAYVWNGTTKTLIAGPTTNTAAYLPTTKATQTISLASATSSTVVAGNRVVIEVYVVTGTSATTAAMTATLYWGSATDTSNVAMTAGTGATWVAASSYTSGTATQELQICFKCHAGATATTGGGLITAPTAAAAFTDLSLEFNPNIMSGHPIITGLNNYPSALAPKALTAAKMKAPWNVTVGTQVMTCSDCHATDTAASKGPHGSAVKWMLSGTNKAWPYTTTGGNGTSTGTLFTVATYSTNNGTANGLFCLNCHTVTASNNWHSNADVATTGGRHGSNAIMACASCHVRVPHGGKISRLLQTTNAPARYKSNGNGATSSYNGWGPTTGTVKGSTVSSANFKASCGTHSGTGGEAW
jgi:predicted CxxxxCH...CXXCH cytochrome family protein